MRNSMLKLDGAAQPINRLFDTVKLREWSGAQKRHTIMRAIRPQIAMPAGRGSLVSL